MLRSCWTGWVLLSPPLTIPSLDSGNSFRTASVEAGSSRNQAQTTQGSTMVETSGLTGGQGQARTCL